ncbi:MAG: PPC domain-containing protein [Acidobacteriota bacterium]
MMNTVPRLTAATMNRETTDISLKYTVHVALLFLCLSAFALPAWPQCGYDPGNGDTSTATPIGGCIQGSYCLDFNDDVDVYRIDPDYPADMTFQTLGSTDTFMELLNSSGQVITQDDDGGQDTNAMITYVVTGGATYYIRVRGYSSTTTGAYDLLISGCCGNDPFNNDFNHTTPFSGAQINEFINCEGDVDLYEFVATDTGDYTFSFSTSNSIVWALYDSAHTQTTTYSNETSRAVSLTAGEHLFLGVKGYQTSDTGAYSLEMSGFTGGGGGCGDDPGNDDTSSATDLGAQCGITGAEIDCVGDYDYYRFTAPSSGSYNMYTAGGTDTYIVLYDASGSSLIWDDDSGQDTNASVVYSLTRWSTYFIAVSEFGDNGMGTYHLYVSGCPGDCGDDPGNSSSGTATPLASCGTTQAAIDCVGDNDWYSFQAPADSTYTWTMSPTNRAGMILYGPDGVTEYDAGQNSVSTTLLQGDVVYVAVSASSPTDIFGYSMELTGCPAGGCGSDPGNDSIPDATDIGNQCATTAGRIDCLGDQDYYRFLPPVSGPITFETTGSTNTYLRLYNEAGSLYSHDADSGTGDNAKIVWTLPTGQFAYIAVHVYDNDETGDYDLIVSGCSGGGCGDDPGNDNFNTATDLGSQCGSSSAVIDCIDDMDVYRFAAPSSGVFNISTTGDIDTVVTLYNHSGTVLISDNDSGQGTNGSIDYSLDQGSTYYISVSAFGGAGTGPYALVVSGCQGGGCGDDPGNDNLAVATALSGCGSTPAAIDCAGDLDYYWFNAPNGGSFTFETTGSTDTELRLYDSNGDAVASDDDSGADHNARIVYTLIDGQKYSIAVNEYANDGTGDYTLVISGCTGGGCGNDPGNDSFAAATVLQGCGMTSAGIDCNGDEDYYRFTPLDDGPHTITMQASFNVYVELYDSGHNLLVQHNSQITWDLQGTSAPYFIAIVSPLGLEGTYDLSISGCDSGGCAGDADGNTIGGATTLNGCGTTPSSIDCPGDVDYFKLIPATSGDYTFETTGSVDTKLLLQDALGADLAFDDDSGQGLNAHLTHSLQSGISYFIRLEAFSIDQTGPYGLTITGCNASNCDQDIEGDTVSSAVSLSTCGVTDAEFDCNDDVDVFRFQAPLSVTYTFSTAGTRDTIIRLLDGNGNPLAVDDNSGNGSNARLTHSMTAGEAVFLEITENGGGLGDYQVEIDGCDATGEPPNEFRYIVTAVAKVEGSEGTNWVSDLAMLNLGEDNANLTIALWERDHANTNPQEIARTLSPGQLDRTTDVLAEMFGQTSGAAALQIRSDQPLAVGSRTYNTVSGKTYGQFISGVEQHDAIPAGERVILSGLAENHAFRTNLGLVNPGDSAINVTATFFDTNGQQLGIRTWQVPAHGYIQRNRVLRELTTAHMRSIWIRLTANSGEFFSFLSIVDQGSGDPVYRPGRTSPLLAEDVLMPGVAKLAGAAGTNWVTDATFTNTTTSHASVKISLWNRDENNSNPTERTFLLHPEQMSQVSDILHSLFGEDAGAAALQVAIEPGILADGRTYNLVDEGTYGQYIPGLGEGSAVTIHRKGYLVMPAENAGFRSNLGLVNPSDQPVGVQVRLFDTGGNQVGNPRAWSLGARDVNQIDRILKRFTNQNMNAGWLEVSVQASTPDGKVHIFNSVIDMESGDPIFETITLGP